MRLPVAACPREWAHAAAVGGRILATIRGSLGTAVHAGRNGLVVCACNLLEEDPVATADGVWTYDKLVRLSAERSGSLSVLCLTIRHRSAVLPLIALDPGAGASTPAAIDRVQHLIEADHESRRFADAGWAPRLAIVGVAR